ncbi:MAG: sigma factor regulatory protein FecR [Rhodospirillales bacterium]|jgi:transmembrane sensor|nr:sigma factor regulatory protein FecR [Rhodospirillales bacterium]
MSTRGTANLPDDATMDVAADWLGRLAGEPDTVDVEALRSWIAADPRHAYAMDLTERTWSALGNPVLWRRVLAEAARGTARGPLPRRDRSQPAEMTRPVSAARWVAAAAVLAAAIVLYRAESVATDHYESSQGERLDVQLSDGSRVRLNGSTQIAVRMLWRKRELLLLTGEAEFDVAHESYRPFTVAADRVVVHATGTDFAVRRDESTTAVVLVSGRVELRNARSSAIEAVLEPGQKASYEPGLPQGRAPTIRRVDPNDELAWRSGKIVFAGTFLGAAVREFARYSPATIRLATPDLEALQVSGIYRVNDFPSFLDNLTRAFPLTWQRQPDGTIQIARRKQ